MKSQTCNPGHLLLLLCICALGCQQSNETRVSPSQTRQELAVEPKSVLLFRSLCLQQFDKKSIETVYGMPGQSWISEKLKNENGGEEFTMYLATGRTDFDTWRAPDPSLIKAIGSEKIRSVTDAKEDDVILIVENIDWRSANHVELDIGTYHKSPHIYGSVYVQFKFVENKWVIADPGGCYTSKLENAE